MNPWVGTASESWEGGLGKGSVFIEPALEDVEGANVRKSTQGTGDLVLP